MKHHIHTATCVGILLGSLPLSCGSSDDGGTQAGAGGSAGIGPDGSFFEVPGPGDLPPEATARNGGSVALTPDQVTSVQSGACEGWSAAGESLPAALQLVIDVSSSMDQQAPGTNLTKWEATRDALIAAIPGDASSPGLAASTPVGALYYPNVAGGSNVQRSPGDIRNCVNVDARVPIATLGDANGPQRQAILSSLQQVQLSTGTPTYDAYTYALVNAMRPFEFAGNRFMLLITDGTPTLSEGCSNPSGRLQAVDPQPVVDAVASAYRDDGIRTFVIGSPGSEDTRASLSAAARLGGTPSSPDCSDSGVPQYCHMDMTTAPDFSQALRDGLGAIVGQIKSCTYTFPTAPEGQTIDPKRVNVIVSTSSGQSTLLLPDDTPEDCTVGFQLTADQRVVLCPRSCQEVQADTRGAIQLLFGCATGTITR